MAYGTESGPLALAHRGGAALAPENTLAAFALATALGVRYLETDVRLTADGELVCFHDATLDRVTDGTRAGRAAYPRVAAGGCGWLGASRSRPWPRRSRPSPTPTSRSTSRTAAAIAPLGEAVAAQGLPRPGLRRWAPGTAGSTSCAPRCPGVRTALGWRSLAAVVTSARAGMPPARRFATAEFAHVPLRLGRVPVFVERLVEGAHRIGVRVVVWTVDDPATMVRLLDAGVDGIITDRPDLLREVLVARDQWLPMPRATSSEPDADRPELAVACRTWLSHAFPPSSSTVPIPLPSRRSTARCSTGRSTSPTLTRPTAGST